MTEYYYVLHQNQVWRVLKRNWEYYLKDVNRHGFDKVPLADYAKNSFDITHVMPAQPTYAELDLLRCSTYGVVK